MSKVLADINVLCSFTSADDIVAPLDARGVVLVHWCGRLLSDTKLRYRISVQAASSTLPLPWREPQSLIIFDFHMIGALLYNMSVPDVDHREKLFPQSASV